jgi:hypothetical protein
VLLPVLEGNVTSTISSSAVSGSITTTNVSSGLVSARVIPPRIAVEEATIIDVALEFSAAVKVVSWDTEEYLRVVID